MSYRKRPISLTKLTVCALAYLATTVAAAQSSPSFKVLYVFGGPGDGFGSSSGVIFDMQGNAYGETAGGGSMSCQGGCGIVYELSPQKNGGWSETILYEFAGGSDGVEPRGGLAMDSAGNLYGVTVLGGTNGYGTAFELTPGSDGWTKTTLYNFCTPPGDADGCEPSFAPMLDAAGNLYGTAAYAVYELSPGPSGWTETTIYTFCSQPNCADGSDPQALIRDGAGNLYGPTEFGGDGGTDGPGVVFSLRLKPGGGWTYVKLHDFVGNALGDFPNAVALHSGALYGSTGGCNVSSCGTVFDLAESNRKIRPGLLYTFTNPTDGAAPQGNLAFDSSGNMYGATGQGGSGCGVGCGVVFELTPGNGTWQYQSLHDFNGSDGQLPQYGVIEHNGHLFGTTLGGGAPYYGGVVFEITP